MTAYSLAVQADVRKRMSPPNRQDVPQISKELGIYRSTLYQWRSNWRLVMDLEKNRYINATSFYHHSHFSCPFCNPRAVGYRQALPIHQGFLNVLHFQGENKFNGHSLLCIASRQKQHLLPPMFG